jgi:hypothetical protein
MGFEVGDGWEFLRGGLEPGRILRDGSPEHDFNGARLRAEQLRPQSPECLTDLPQIWWRGNQAQDFRVSRGDNVFGLVRKLLEEFLAGADADELDLNVDLGFEPAEFDHLAPGRRF